MKKQLKKPARISQADLAGIAAEGVARALAAREICARELSPEEVEGVSGGATLKFNPIIAGGIFSDLLKGLNGGLTAPQLNTLNTLSTVG